MYPAIFLDRDGVIIENIPYYVRSWDDVLIYPQALQALATLSKHPYKIIIVTNQSAVGRGLVTLETVDAINKRLIREIEQHGGRVDAVFTCPHAPQEECACRKPKPGLIYQAQEHLAIDLSKSILIGDALSDLAAGKAAGVGKTILVLTGRGAAQLYMPEAETLKPYPVYLDLKTAIDIEFGDDPQNS
jgi:D-glycero-D-manno-heptose 1,7-bisphosphate phosphatase